MIRSDFIQKHFTVYSKIIIEITVDSYYAWHLLAFIQYRRVLTL